MESGSIGNPNRPDKNLIESRQDIFYFGSILRLARERAGLKPVNIGRTLGHGSSVPISKWENGENLPDIEKTPLAVIARAYEITDPSEILELEKAFYASRRVREKEKKAGKSTSYASTFGVPNDRYRSFPPGVSPRNARRKASS